MHTLGLYCDVVQSRKPCGCQLSGFLKHVCFLNVEAYTLPWFDETCTGKKQMDIVMAAEKAEVSVLPAGPLVTVGLNPRCWSVTTR